jgi:hypothetical protein
MAYPLMIAFLAQHNLLGTIQFAECISNSSASLLSHISWYGAPKKKKKRSFLSFCSSSED